MRVAAHAVTARRTRDSADAAEGRGGDAYLVARDGYLDVYELLARRCPAMAYRAALQLCGHHHDAQDLAREALIGAWQNLDRFRADASFATWLYQIVTRRALNKLTRSRGTGSLDVLGELPDPDAEPATRPNATWPSMPSPTRSPRCRSPSGR